MRNVKRFEIFLELEEKVNGALNLRQIITTVNNIKYLIELLFINLSDEIYLTKFKLNVQSHDLLKHTNYSSSLHLIT